MFILNLVRKNLILSSEITYTTQFALGGDWLRFARRSIALCVPWAEWGHCCSHLEATFPHRCLSSAEALCHDREHGRVSRLGHLHRPCRPVLSHDCKARRGPRGGALATQLSSLVEDLHTKRLFVLVLVVIDVDQDLFLPGAAAWHEPQANGVGLSSCHLEGVLLELQQVRAVTV